MLLSGCGLKSDDESSHPFFKQGIKAQEASEFEQATKYFNRYISLKPDSSKAHLRLASIYDENLDKPLHAVYHYERFLELSPNSPEAKNIKKWQNAALKKYYYKARLQYNDPEDINALQNTLYQTKKELKKYKTELKKIKYIQQKLIQFARKTRDSERKLKAKLSSLQDAHQKSLDESKKLRTELEEKAKLKEDKKEEVKAEKETVEKKEVKTEPKTETKAEVKEEKDKPLQTIPKAEVKEEKDKPLQAIPKAAAATPPFVIKKTDEPEVKTNIEIPEAKVDIEVRTYTVKRGDSLSSISRQFYGASKHYKLIFEANRDTIKSEKDLRLGQVLKIPLL